MNYDVPTKETDAFMLHIHDSEVDLGQIESKLKQFEAERDAARKDSALLDHLQQAIQSCPHTDLTYYEDRPDNPWELETVGCNTVYFVGKTLREILEQSIQFDASGEDFDTWQAQKEAPTSEAITEKETPVFSFIHFNPRRAARNKEAAQVKATWPDGESEYLWMSKEDIEANAADHGWQEGLIAASDAYKQSS
jgi:hypothetical protein